MRALCLRPVAAMATAAMGASFATLPCKLSGGAMAMLWHPVLQVVWGCYGIAMAPCLGVLWRYGAMASKLSGGAMA